MDEPKLIRVQNPRAFLVPSFNALIAKALSTSPLVRDPQQAIFELVNHIEKPQLALFVVIEGIELTAAAIAECSGSAFSPGCFVRHFFNEGSSKARKLLFDGIIDFAKSSGESRIFGVDINQKPRAFVKLFSAAGPATARGVLFDFDLSEAEE